MENYKKLYLKMVRASEKAIRILIEAQQECEERLLEELPERPPIELLGKKREKGEPVE